MNFAEERKRFLLLGLLPPWAVIGVFMIGPILVMAVVSLLEANSYGGVHPRFSLEAYQQILFDYNLFDELEFNPAYLLRSFALATIATACCLLIGFPTAYYMARQPEKQKNLLIFLVTIPFWTNLLIRTFAWIIILGRNGTLEMLLRKLGLLGPEQFLGLMYTDFAIAVGLTYSYLPLMVLPIFSSMEKLDFRLLEAGSDLYASRFDLVWRLIAPLTKPGIVGGCVLVFVPCLGAFIAPDLLGGGKKLMLGSLVQMQFATSRNWPFGAAIAMFLLACVVVSLMVQARSSGPQKAVATAH